MKAALFQARTGIDPARNAAGLTAAIGEAAAGGAMILFTPEMSGLLDRDRARAEASLHEEGDDPVLAAVREAAAASGIWVHLGSLALKRADGRLACDSSCQKRVSTCPVRASPCSFWKASTAS